MIDTADVTLFRNLFARVDDAYGVMGAKNPLAIRKPLTTQLLKEHLSGRKRIGAYLVDTEGMANQIVIDLDIPKEKADHPKEWDRVASEARAILRELDELGVEAFVTSSKSRGFHVRTMWESAPASELRRIGHYVLRRTGVDAEVFPKQDRRSEGGLGSLVWLPLFGPDVTKGKTAILDRANGLDPFPDQWEALRNVRINSLDKLNSALAIVKEWEKVSDKGSTRKSADPIGNRIPEGQRNNTLTSLAGTMRRRGMPERAITAALLEVNADLCDPPLHEKEVRLIIRSISKYESKEDAATQFTEHFRATDLWAAKLFTYLYAGNAKCCPKRGGWHVYDGKRWVRSECGEIERMAKEIPRAILELALAESDKEVRKSMYRFAATMESAKRIDFILSLAATEKGIALPPDAFDPDPWKFNVQNGTVVIDPVRATVELRPHDFADMITNISPAEWQGLESEAPIFRKFLEESADGDKELMAFRRRLAGYALTGDMREQVFEYAYGPEAGGKGTETRARADVMGTYCRAAEMATFLIFRTDKVRNDLAGLVGARLVTASEPQEGQVFDEGLIRMLTGQDRMKARFLYKEGFEFTCGFKIRFEGNHRPHIRSTGGATWRRLLVIPFERTVPEEKRDKTLSEKLKSPKERAGILAWMVRGALEWVKDGLAPPAKVKAAVADYRRAEDRIDPFIEDRCMVGDNLKVSSGDLYSKYKFWCDTSGERPMSQRAIALRLEDKGFVRIKMHGGVRGWRGIALQDKDQERVEALKAKGRRIKSKFENSHAKRVSKGTLREKPPIRLRRSDAPPPEKD